MVNLNVKKVKIFANNYLTVTVLHNLLFFNFIYYIMKCRIDYIITKGMYMSIVSEFLFVLLVGASGGMIWTFIMGMVLLFSRKPSKFIWIAFAVCFIVAALSYLGISLS